LPALESFARLDRAHLAITRALRAGIGVATPPRDKGGRMLRATATFAAGLGLGAGLMYYLDPDRGSRRRTHARNQLIHASNRVPEARALLDRVANALGARGLPEQIPMPLPRARRLAWVRDRMPSRRTAAALAGVAGAGLM